MKTGHSIWIQNWGAVRGGKSVTKNVSEQK